MTETEIVMLPIDALHPHPDNPRKDVGDVTELAESIKANGVLQNLTVVPYFSPVHKRVMNGLYTVIIGHRRLAAAKQAGLTEMPCVIVEMTEKEQLSTMLTENMQRVDLTVYEQAQGFQMMLDMGDTMDEIADKSGFSKTTVRKRLEIAKLDSKTLKNVSARQITLADFDELAKVEDIEERNRLLASMGTPNFKNELNSALKRQQTAKRMQEWLEVIRTFATEDAEAHHHNLQYVTNYGYWTLTKEVVVPEDAGTMKYYYKVGREQIDIYKEKDIAKEDAEKAAREERARRAELRKHLFTDINQRHYNLRRDFVRNLSNAVCKQNRATVYGFLADAFYHETDSYKDVMDLDALAYLLDVVTVDKDAVTESGKLTASAGIRSAVEAFPEKLMFCIAYCVTDSVRNDYWRNEWVDGQYEYRHRENSELDALYNLLETLGYEMSDEEKAMQDGSHAAFATHSDDEDDEVLEPEDLADLDELVEDDVDED